MEELLIIVEKTGKVLFMQHDSIVKLLLKGGADKKLCTKDGLSPLNAARSNGHISTEQLLLNNGICM